MTDLQPITKGNIERMCLKAGTAPADRIFVGDYEILISDGFSLPPHRVFRKFGIGPDDFPKGCYCTFWWLMKGDNLYFGKPLFFDAFHDPEYDAATKRRARINRARDDATVDLMRATAGLH
jgi:hypothetical protein